MQQTPKSSFTGLLFRTLVGVTVCITPLLAGAVVEEKSEILLPVAFPQDPEKLRMLWQLPSCNSQSGLLADKGDDYYALPPLEKDDSDTKTITAEVHQFDQLLKKIEGNWDGKAVESVCYGKGHSRLHAYEVDEVEIEHRGSGKRYSGNHHSVARVAVERVRVSSSEKYSSDGDIRSITVFKVPQLSGFHEIEKIAEDQFRVSRLYRERTTLNGGSVLREREDWIANTGKELAWRTDWYTNGHYSGSELNILKRQR